MTNDMQWYENALYATLYVKSLFCKVFLKQWLVFDLDANPSWADFFLVFHVSSDVTTAPRKSDKCWQKICAI